MIRKFFFTSIFFLGWCSCSFSQEQDSLTVETTMTSTKNAFKLDLYDPLAPARSAFYSAILPGLGQAYNGSYWKIPLVYAGIGTSLYLVLQNDTEYQRYRDAYKRRLAGFQDDEFQNILENDGLINAQKQFRQNKEFAILATVAFYLFNIVDANVDAHLKQFDVSKDLTLRPNFEPNFMSGNIDYGLTLNFKLN
ncbi:hypothetical protein P700755_003449 [Psychroflexus torquis ATCC 700755]|uniref:DUF5683 domain-containing protein n=1 Tax=Psychroflexus torquis (strain ATCC 700755 / CIP 106069 / ACAM 623) TaxID=313595 RepID=K4ILY7_PSYTT|nr:DUF5683 domain-containing protein [Psychroflexus torquis]AFU70076.1 hypothetical protein P700755_003449 [Psychroflexus torquis ATCC 700755]